jgi:uncharacterized damage-inducible protein DinB
MSLSLQVAKHFREVFTGENWTCVNLKDTLEGVTWQQAITKVHSFNTIAALVYHMTYYVDRAMKVLQGGELATKDEDSFSHPSINSEQDWETMRQKVWANVEAFATLAEQMPDERFFEVFTNEKYGNYYRNITGITEHTYYHLGQIVLIKKILQA